MEKEYDMYLVVCLSCCETLKVYEESDVYEVIRICDFCIQEPSDKKLLQRMSDVIDSAQICSFPKMFKQAVKVILKKQ